MLLWNFRKLSLLFLSCHACENRNRGAWSYQQFDYLYFLVRSIIVTKQHIVNCVAFFTKSFSAGAVSQLGLSGLTSDRATKRPLSGWRRVRGLLTTTDCWKRSTRVRMRGCVAAAGGKLVPKLGVMSRTEQLHVSYVTLRLHGTDRCIVIASIVWLYGASFDACSVTLSEREFQ